MVSTSVYQGVNSRPDVSQHLTRTPRNTAPCTHQIDRFSRIVQVLQRDAIMLRLQPTTISLKTAELKEYERPSRLRQGPASGLEHHQQRSRLWLQHGPTGSLAKRSISPPASAVVSPFDRVRPNGASESGQSTNSSDDEAPGNSSTTSSGTGSSSGPAEVLVVTVPTQYDFLSAQTGGGHAAFHANDTGEGKRGVSQDETTPVASKPRSDATPSTPSRASAGTRAPFVAADAVNRTRPRGRSRANSIPKTLPPPFSTTPRAMPVCFRLVLQVIVTDLSCSQGGRRRSSDAWRPVGDGCPSEPTPRVDRRRRCSASVRFSPKQS